MIPFRQLECKLFCCFVKKPLYIYPMFIESGSSELEFSNVFFVSRMDFLSLCHSNNREVQWVERKNYYVSLQSREISQIKFGNNHHFTIYATDEEVGMLRKKLDRVYEAEIDSFWRSHVPFVPYHHDLANDSYDEAFSEALEMIYKLGDEQAKVYIETSGVLTYRPLDSNL